MPVAKASKIPPLPTVPMKGEPDNEAMGKRTDQKASL
jgi:hypothetical protein